MMRLAESSDGRSDLVSSAPLKVEPSVCGARGGRPPLPRARACRVSRRLRVPAGLQATAGRTKLVGGGHRLDGGAAAGGGGLVERGRAHGEDLDRVGGLDGGDGVAGVDRAHKGVGALDGHDVRDLRGVQLRAQARHEVLAKGGVRGDDVVEVALLLDAGHQVGVVLRQAVVVRGVLGHKHLAHAGDLAGGLGHSVGAVAGHEQRDAAQLGGRGDGRQGGAGQLRQSSEKENGGAGGGADAWKAVRVSATARPRTPRRRHQRTCLPSCSATTSTWPEPAA